MPKSTKYVSHTPDENGFITYSEQENATWATLIERQLPRLEGQVCQEYIDALALMDFPRDRIPQLPEISAVLQEHTGWSVAPVPALIDFTSFFELLANKQFPAATFIRDADDLDYLEEPDIFHEIFGHTPLLTDYRFAAFTEAYGKAGLAADKKDHAMLARLFWFTALSSLPFLLLPLFLCHSLSLLIFTSFTSFFLFIPLFSYSSLYPVFHCFPFSPHLFFLFLFS